MKLKLSFAEFTVLLSLLQKICIGQLPVKMQGVVVHGVLFRLYKKFYSKGILTKRKYTITMENDEAAAFFLFFNKYDLTGEQVFTINLITQIKNSIHQKFPA